MKNIILSAKKLSKSFAHNGGQIHILSQIDFDLYQNDFTIIMGTSGSGKSTLLYALSGMDRATAGQVIYNDNNLVTMNENSLAKLRCNDFGFVFQSMHLISNLTIYENIAVAGYLNKNNTSKSTCMRADDLISKMGLDSIKTHLPSQVSGGEQQRCAIARAVINTPKILFADEPTGALNRKNTNDVLDLLTNLNKSGQSILMVTHDIRAALRSTRLLYLDDGKIIGELELPEYKPEDEKRREVQVNAWLNSLEW